jgi:hypothetical protein
MRFRLLQRNTKSAKIIKNTFNRFKVLMYRLI